MGLWYSKDSCIALTTFADADHAGCQDTRKSTFRSMQLLGDRLVSWSSKKSTAISSTEAEYIAFYYCAQQIALDNALVVHEIQVKIGKCNMMIDPEITPKEPTYQVVLDTLALTTCYPAFSSLQKRFSIDMEVFREILQICPRLPDQEFDELPSEEEILSFIKDLGHTGNIKKITDMVIDHMHQPLRDFAAIINKEDLAFQIDNRNVKKQEKMYYPRFTKAIIHHFLSKDKSISMRNKMFMHTAPDDYTLG
ncbi:hypothetical protein Tco_1063935, partial [Tanacetum coccineum]